jgi:hypothetical protein
MGFWIRTLNFVVFCCQWTQQGGDSETMWLVPLFYCDESLIWRGLNFNLGHFHCFTFIFVRVENRVCLSHGVQMTGATWWAAMRIMAGVGDIVQRIGDGRTGRVLGGRAIERSGDVMCVLYCA